MECTITGTVDSATQDKIIVKVERQSACQGCEASHVCHSFAQPTMNFSFDKPDFDVREGDKVMIAMENPSFLKACAITYLIPLVFVISGIAIAKILSMSEGIQAIAGLCTFVISLPLVRRLGKTIQGPKLIERING
jgi:sigma-E factor negative regulatory protein RseC